MTVHRCLGRTARRRHRRRPGRAGRRRAPHRPRPAVRRAGGRRRGRRGGAQWGHIRTFTPWRYIVDPTAEKLLAPTGWTRPATPVPPTGDELVEHYLRPLARCSRRGARRARGWSPCPATAWTRRAASGAPSGRSWSASGTGRRPSSTCGPARSSTPPAPGRSRTRWARPACPPRARTRPPRSSSGRCPTCSAATGTGSPAGARSSSAPGTRPPTPCSTSAGCADEEPGTRSSGRSAAPTPATVYGGGAADELAARGRLGTDLRAWSSPAPSSSSPVRDHRAGARRRHRHRRRADAGRAGATEGLHNVAAATGFRPDLAMLAELRLDLDPGLEAPRALGAADRPRVPLLRHRPAARPPRPGPPRGRLLRRRHEVLRAGADLPHHDRQRAGPQRRRGPGR